MAQAHNAHSIIIGCIASGVIAVGHAVELASNSAGVYTVNQADSANEAWGVYVGDEAAADADHVSICIFGPCYAWLDGAITVNPPQPLSNDTDGHIVAETADKKRAIGWAMETNGATENYGEMFVFPHYTSL
jgi:hypothetical protein